MLAKSALVAELSFPINITTRDESEKLSVEQS